MERVYICLIMEIFFKENGVMVSLMGKGLMKLKIKYIQENGKMGI